MQCCTCGDEDKRRKILISRSYIKLQSGWNSLSRRYFGMLKAAMEEAEKMEDGGEEITL